MPDRSSQPTFSFDGDVRRKTRARKLLVEKARRILEELRNAHNVYSEEADLLKILGASLRDLLYNVIPKNQRKKPRYKMIYPEKLEEVALKVKAGPHTGVTQSLLLLCLIHANGYEDGMVMLDRDELAAKLGIKPEQVSRSISLLEEYGAVTKMRDKGRARYFMDATVGWYGPETDLQVRARYIDKTLPERAEKAFGRNRHLGI